jgi:hypothetical protein
VRAHSKRDAADVAVTALALEDKHRRTGVWELVVRDLYAHTSTGMAALVHVEALVMVGMRAAWRLAATGRERVHIV